MDKFKVGQKVRKIRHSGRFSDVVPIGSVGEVIAINSRSSENSNPIYCWVVYEYYESSHFNKSYAQHPNNIEPIYDGDIASTWSECAWKPNKEKVS